jgi:hypothetical protein
VILPIIVNPPDYIVSSNYSGNALPDQHGDIKITIFEVSVKKKMRRGTCTVVFFAFFQVGAGVAAPTSGIQIPPQPLLRPDKEKATAQSREKDKKVQTFPSVFISFLLILICLNQASHQFLLFLPYSSSCDS